MSVFNFLHRDGRDKFYRKPFTTSIPPLRAVPATPGPLEIIPVHDPPACGHQRELSESRYCRRTASVLAALSSLPFPEAHHALSRLGASVTLFPLPGTPVFPSRLQ